MTMRLQRWLDVARDASPQRWALGSIAVLAIATATVLTVVGSGERVGWLSWFTIVMAAVAAVQAGSHTSTFVIALVVVRWLAAVDDVATPRSPVVAGCLLLFHSTLALMAVTPHSAHVHPAVLRTWGRRIAAVLAATAVVWLLVRVVEPRNAGENPFLTWCALVAIGAATVALGRRSNDDTTV